MAKTKRKPKELTFEVLRAALFEECKRLGATNIRVPYDGSGDDGQVEDPELTGAGGNPIAIPEDLKVGWFIEAGYDYGPNNEIIPVRAGVEDVTISEALERYCYEVLGQHFPGDWVNNEGGYGELKIELTLPPKIVLEAHQRVLTTNDYDIGVETGQTIQESICGE